jgi:hypothetical protein
MKIRPVGAQLFHADGRTDRRTDVMQLMTFRNFVMTPKNKYQNIWKNVGITLANGICLLFPRAVNFHYYACLVLSIVHRLDSLKAFLLFM